MIYSYDDIVIDCCRIAIYDQAGRVVNRYKDIMKLPVNNEILDKVFFYLLDIHTTKDIFDNDILKYLLCNYNEDK